MTYTKETLHGLIYAHHSKPNKFYRVIEIRSSGVNTHTNCDAITGITETQSAWFNVDMANDWLARGIWIPKSKVINNYEIY